MHVQSTMVFHSILSLYVRRKLQLILDSSKAHEEYFKFDHFSELQYGGGCARDYFLE